MFKTILIPLDGSALGERALPLALHLARGAGIRLLLLQSARDLALLTRLEAERGIAVTLEPHLDALRRSGAETTPGLAGPLSVSEILRVVRDDDVDLVVMSIQGRVADDVLRRAPVLGGDGASVGRKPSKAVNAAFIAMSPAWSFTLAPVSVRVQRCRRWASDNWAVACRFWTHPTLLEAR